MPSRACTRQTLEGLRQALARLPPAPDGRVAPSEELVDVLRRLAALPDEHPLAHFWLGRALQAKGQIAEAIAALEAHVLRARRRKEREPDLSEASLRLALSEHLLAALQGRCPPVAPPEYVASLFDRYAPTFEEHAMGRLHYQCPAELVRILSGVWLPDAATSHRVLDLGAGTGILGPELRDRFGPSARLEAVDLSSEMLHLALQKECYDRLLCADVSAAFTKRKRPMPTLIADPVEEETDVEASADDGFSIVVAADVFPYIGSLDPLFSLVARWLKDSGVFAFSVELLESVGETREEALVMRSADSACAVPVGYQLRATGRYSHSVEYIQYLAATHRFLILRQQASTLRYDGGHAVVGMLFVLAHLQRSHRA